MCFLRYGTERPPEGAKTVATYRSIGKRLHMPPNTVFRALKRYRGDGLRFVERRKLNFRKSWEGRVKLKGAVRDYLLSHEVLSDWAPLSLEKRVKLLAQLGVRVAPHTLSAFYRRNKVSYRVVKYEFSRARKVPLE